MKGCLKPLLVLIAVVAVFLLVLILLYKGAMRPCYDDYRSSITGVEVSEGSAGDLALSGSDSIQMNSVEPIVLKMRILVKDKLVSSRRSGKGFLLFLPGVNAAVDPGRIFSYSFPDPLSELKIYGCTGTDSIDVSESFNLVRDPVCYPQNDSVFSCQNNAAADFIMRNMKEQSAYCRSFVIFHNMNALSHFGRFSIAIKLTSGMEFSCEWKNPD